MRSILGIRSQVIPEKLHPLRVSTAFDPGYRVKVLEGGALHHANLAFGDDEREEVVAKAKHGPGGAIGATKT